MRVRSRGSGRRGRAELMEGGGGCCPRHQTPFIAGAGSATRSGHGFGTLPWVLLLRGRVPWLGTTLSTWISQGSQRKGSNHQEKDLEVAVLACKVGQNKWESWREHRDGGGDQSTHKGVGQEGPVFLSGDEDLDMAVHRNGKETVGDLQARS